MSKSGRKPDSIPWNKGIPMSEGTKRKVSLSKKGKSPAWNKGLSMPTIAAKMMGNTNGKGGKGKVMSLEARRKMRLAKLGKPSGRKGMKFSKEWRENIGASRKGEIHSVERLEANRQGQYRRYLKINPDYQVATRNKRIATNGGFHTSKEWIDLKETYNFTCPACKKSEPEITLTRDHILPILLGGRNDIRNIQPLCMKCNAKKHIQIVRY